MFYITTPIPYTNAKPHLGHLLEAVFNDTIARFYRRLYPQTILSMGLDQHGIKIYQKALEQNQDPVDYAVEQGKTFKNLWSQFNISYDRFVETTSIHHKLVAKIAWSKLAQKGFIYKKSYEGLYCIGDESFVTEKDLIDGCCPNHPGQKPILMKEENYFFTLSKFSNQIRDFLKKADIQPVYVSKEFLNFVDEGLQDISISRDKTKMPHGIDIPGDDSQVMYVWFDALLNYLTAVAEPSTLDSLSLNPDNQSLQEAVWTQISESLPIDLMYLGKDIAKFHLVVWIGMLVGLELELPKRALVHGFINDSQGRKFSKSLGNGVMPEELVEKFGVDGTRFILLFEVNVDGDTNFDWYKVTSSYNAHLADNLGNLVMRVTTLVEKLFKGYVDFDELNSPFDFSEVYKKLDKLNTREALEIILKGCSWGNELLEKEKPWQLAKAGKIEEAKEILTKLCKLLCDISEILSIFMPETGDKIRTIITNTPITKATPLFPKVDVV